MIYNLNFKFGSNFALDLERGGSWLPVWRHCSPGWLSLEYALVLLLLLWSLHQIMPSWQAYRAIQNRLQTEGVVALAAEICVTEGKVSHSAWLQLQKQVARYHYHLRYSGGKGSWRLSAVPDRWQQDHDHCGTLSWSSSGLLTCGDSAMLDECWQV